MLKVLMQGKSKQRKGRKETEQVGTLSSMASGQVGVVAGKESLIGK